MTKTVFTNDQCVHVWAQQTQDHGSNGKGSISFNGPTLCSYRTPIARFGTAPNGDRVCYFNTCSYSITTSRHQSRARSAVHGVREVCLRSGNLPDEDPATPRSATVFQEELTALVGDYQKEVARLRRCKTDPFTHSRWGYPLAAGDTENEPAVVELRHAVVKIRDFAALTSLPVPEINEEADTETLRQYWAQKNAKAVDPVYAAKRERANARALDRRLAKMSEWEMNSYLRRLRWKTSPERYAEIQNKFREKQEAAFDEWRAWKRNTCPAAFRTDTKGNAYLRVRADTVQTSMGAEVPLEHAVKVFQFVRKCREEGREWTANGETMRVGHFTVSHVDPDGSFTAGCHQFTWPEIERCAREAGVV